MRKILLLSIALFIHGCASKTIFYKQYTEKEAINASTLEGASMFGTLGYGGLNIYIIRVNDKFCKPDFPKCNGIELLPGTYRIKIGIENVLSYSDTTIELTVGENKRYVIKSEESKPDFFLPVNTDSVWLIDSDSGLKVMKIEGWSAARSRK
jgi:hypothetical protein